MKNINPKYFNAFLAVVESNSFSHAASKAYMTQANISKHIQALEDQLGHQLFVRTNKNPVITEAGKSLLEYIKKLNELNAELQLEISGNKQSMKGIVHYSLTHPTMLLSSFSKLRDGWLEFKNIEMHVDIDPHENIITGILEGKLDFGFVSSPITHANLACHPCGKEEFVMVSKNKDISSAITNTETLLINQYIAWPGMGDHFDGWRECYFPECDVVNSSTLYYSGRSNNIESAILMVRGGMGISVFPRATVQSYIESGKFFEWKAAGGKRFFRNSYLVHLNDQELPKRVNAVIDFFIPDRQ